MIDRWLPHDATVLVIAAHPDDETLGCGGTISRLSRMGADVHVSVVTVGSLARVGGTSAIAQRLEEFAAACQVLGVTSGQVCWPDETRHMRLDVTPRLELVRLLEEEADLSLASIRPDVLFIPSHIATNQDHAAIHQAAFIVARPHANSLKHVPQFVLGYTIPEERAWSTSELGHTVAVDTSGHLETKLKALAAYASQAQPHGHPRHAGRVEELDRAAGYDLGVTAAERFVPYRFLT